MTKRSATVTLTSYDLGDVTEADYDAWTDYVTDQIDGRTGLDVTVEREPFAASGSDRIEARDEEDEQTIREAIEALWVDFCAEPAEAS